MLDDLRTFLMTDCFKEDADLINNLHIYGASIKSSNLQLVIFSCLGNKFNTEKYLSSANLLASSQTTKLVYVNVIFLISNNRR